MAKLDGKTDPQLEESYNYNDLEAWFDRCSEIDPNMIWKEHGMDAKIELGEAFIMISAANVTYSFMFTGHTVEGSIWKLIFKCIILCANCHIKEHHIWTKNYESLSGNKKVWKKGQKKKTIF
jgi:hypothetical protein